MPSEAVRLSDEGVEGVLAASLRAPSAHNAQPWRISRVGPHAYLIWYAYADKLLADPDDRDGLLAMGGYFETLRLAAHRAGLEIAFEPDFSAHSTGIRIGVVRFGVLDGAADPLAAAIAKRQCNRFPYQRMPLPAELRAGLEEFGNLLLPPQEVTHLVSRGSVLSWKDSRFVSDLAEWTRFDYRHPDGMTFDCLRVSVWDAFWLRVALRLGKLPGWLAWIYAQRDVRLTRNSSALAVLTVEGRSPETLFAAGRRLIKSWTLLNGYGYAWHPMSVVIDQATVDDLRRQIGGRDPVAIYRVGYTPHSAAISKRRPLERVLVPAP